MTTTGQKFTAEDLLRMPYGGCCYELMKGELSLAGCRHPDGHHTQPAHTNSYSPLLTEQCDHVDEKGHP